MKKVCKICGNPLPKRYRIYCSAQCRWKEYNKRYAEYRKEWGRSQRGAYAPNKKKCKICGKWYVQVGTHIVQKHGMTAREYREHFGLPVKRGIVPSWYRKEKGETALRNKTYENLKKGKKHWYKKKDKRAVATTFWKGRSYKPDEYYE